MNRSIAIALVSTSLAAVTLGARTQPQLRHANHIFNAIHGSMRQFGSSLNHNGMSLFVATVPEGTQFYHGSSSSSRVNGTEWLAFEPEHALIFARPRREPPPGPPREAAHVTQDPLLIEIGIEHYHSQRRLMQTQETNKPDLMVSENIGEPKGYLHTYRTKHALRLLYLDGQSAAKSQKGTLDLQDMVLLHHEPPMTNDNSSGGLDYLGRQYRELYLRGPQSEAERAERMCTMAQQEWNDRIDGFIRMEGGFETILCDFVKHLDVVSITQSGSDGHKGPNGRNDGEMLSYYQAVAARYDGIGGHRVSLNYDEFVTLFSYENTMYFDDTGRPRVNNETSAIEPVRSDIKNLMLRQEHNPKTDWQTVADMVVARYADKIAYLSSGDIKSLDDFRAEIDLTLRPFVDYSRRNQSKEISHCAVQFMPQNAIFPHSLAALTVWNVTTTICQTLSFSSTVQNPL